MKSAKNELASIMFYIDRISMSKPSLRFSVYHDDKLIFQTTGSNSYKTLIGEIYGVEAAKNVIESSYIADGYKTLEFLNRISCIAPVFLFCYYYSGVF